MHVSCDDLRVGEPPDARQARELPVARGAEELLALRVVALGALVRVLARAVGHLDRERLALLLAASLRHPSCRGSSISHVPIARGLARVRRQVAVRVDRAARPRGACARARRAPRGCDIHSPRLRSASRPRSSAIAAQRALRRQLADPAGLVVDRRRLDARVREELPRRALALLAPDPQEVRLEDRRAKLLLSPLPHGASGHRRRGAHGSAKRMPGGRTVNRGEESEACPPREASSGGQGQVQRSHSDPPMITSRPFARAGLARLRRDSPCISRTCSGPWESVFQRDAALGSQPPQKIQAPPTHAKKESHARQGLLLHTSASLSGQSGGMSSTHPSPPEAPGGASNPATSHVSEASSGGGVPASHPVNPGQA